MILSDDNILILNGISHEEVSDKYKAKNTLIIH